MECGEVRPHLVRYVDNDLPRKTSALVEEHLERCYHCAEELHETVALLDRCADALRHPEPRDRFDLLRAELAAPALEEVMPLSTPWDVFRQFAAAAAIILILIGAAHTAAVTLEYATRVTDQMMAWMNAPPPIGEPEIPGGPPLVNWRQRMLWAQVDSGVMPSALDLRRDARQNETPAGTPKVSEGPVSRKDGPEKRREILLAQRSGAPGVEFLIESSDRPAPFRTL